jgi:hypothetical protein
MVLTKKLLDTTSKVQKTMFKQGQKLLADHIKELLGDKSGEIPPSLSTLIAKLANPGDLSSVCTMEKHLKTVVDEFKKIIDDEKTGEAKALEVIACTAISDRLVKLEKEVL